MQSFRRCRTSNLPGVHQSPNKRPTNPSATAGSTSLFAAAEATVAIAAVDVVEGVDFTITEVLVTVVGKQIPGLFVLQPPAQQPAMAVRLTLALLPTMVVAGQVQ